MCDNDTQEGSGWIAAPGFVVTNAHVVAGEKATKVQDAPGRIDRRTVIAFDPVHDVAVLDVPALAARPLPMANGAVGNVGAVYGHPGGGALRASPARVGDEILAVGTDIYRTGSSRRHVYVLAAKLAPGDSGGALVNKRGLGDRHGVRHRPGPERDGLRAHRRGDQSGARRCAARRFVPGEHREVPTRADGPRSSGGYAASTSTTRLR